MNSPSITTKTCRCGEHVPAGCVRCRECGDFLHEETRRFHEENLANDQPIWMVAYRGQQFGPFPPNMLRQVLATRDVPADALVWKPGLSDWIAAERVAELSQ